MGSTMVPLGRKLVNSNRLSIQTTLVSGTVWSQFAMQVLTGGSTTSCRLLIVTTVSAVSPI